MEPEESLGDKELSISAVTFPKFLANELKTKPNSWKLHTLSSFYWRFKGNAQFAIECARRAIYLAPRKFRDIPLLSLGTILQRTKNLNDSIVVLNAAVDHAPNTPENQLALGNSLIMMSDFNRSMECYEIAKSLDRMHSEKVNYIKKSINCFRGLKIVLLTMER
jgi:tetratricopeptide (TPR) repeat protein